MPKKVAIIDSSVLLSLYLRDSLYTKAIDSLEEIQFSHQLFVPDIVFCEVINVLYREKLSEVEIAEIINDMNFRNITVSHLDPNFWSSHFLSLVRKIRLKSADLLILSYAYYYEPDTFVTFDLTLQKSYNQLK